MQLQQRPSMRVDQGSFRRLIVQNPTGSRLSGSHLDRYTRRRSWRRISNGLLRIGEARVLNSTRTAVLVPGAVVCGKAPGCFFRHLDNPRCRYILL